MVRCRAVLAAVLSLCHAERDMEGTVSMTMMQDGHFVFEHDLDDESPIENDVPASAPDLPKRGTLNEQLLENLPGQDLLFDGRPADGSADRPGASERAIAVHADGGTPEAAAVESGPATGTRREQKATHDLALEPDQQPELQAFASPLGPLRSSMLEMRSHTGANAETEAWLGETSRLLSLLTQEPTGDPFPEEVVTEKPTSWTTAAWNAYRTAREIIAPFRGGVGNMMATFASMGLGPDSCILKLAYTLYTHVGEDDYPYMPEGCGSGFDFRTSMSGSVSSRGTPVKAAVLVLLGALIRGFD